MQPLKGDAVGNEHGDLIVQLLNLARSDKVVNEYILPVSWKTISENFSISPSGIYLRDDRVAKVKIKSLKGRTVEPIQTKMSDDIPVQIKQVKEEGQLNLEFQNFPSKGKPNNQVPWRGKIQLILRDGIAEEKCWITLIK